MRILALAIGLAASSPAWALSCLWGISDANVEPDDRVPTNAVLLVEHTFDATVDVEGERGGRGPLGQGRRPSLPV